MSDARFADGTDSPLRLIAQDAEDVPVVATLLQDAVLSAADIRLDRRRRRLAALVSRFRWEDRDAAEAAGRPYERVRCLVVIEDVIAVRSQGFARTDRDLVLSILSLDWAPGQDGGGILTFTLAGDGLIEATVEALEVRLDDVARPHAAAARRAPDHGLD